MKIFTLLRSRIGAISKSGALSVLLTAGSVGVMVSNYLSASSAVQEAKVRSLAQIMSTGGELPREYSGINVSAGKVQLASAEDIAAWEGDMFDAGETEVAALNSFNLPNIKGSALSAGEDGLGMGANAAVALDANGKPMVTGGNISGVNAAAQAVQSQAEQAAGAQKKEKTLARANMAVASGNNLSFQQASGNSGTSGAVAHNSSGVATQKLKNGEIPSMLTGSMPAGSMLVDVPAVWRGAHSSSFQPGDVRTRVQHGINSKEGNDLKSLAKEVGVAAQNRDSYGATGAHLRNATRGVMLARLNQSNGNNSVNTPPPGRKFRPKNIGAPRDGFKKEAQKEKERQGHRSRLLGCGIALILATIGAGFLINKLMKTPASAGWGWAIFGVMLAAIAVYMVDCGIYIKKYNEERGWAIAGLAVGVAAIGALIASLVSGIKAAATAKAAAAAATGGAASGAGGGAGFGAQLATAAQSSAIGGGLTKTFEEATQMFKDGNSDDLANG